MQSSSDARASGSSRGRTGGAVEAPIDGDERIFNRF